jgi:tricin synthase
MAPSGNTVPNVHSSIDSSNKTLLKSDALYTYILDTTVFPREPECMRDLRLVTDKHPWYVTHGSLLFSACTSAPRSALI